MKRDDPAIAVLGGVLFGAQLARVFHVPTYADVREWLDSKGGVFYDVHPEQYPELGHECPDCGCRSFFRHDAGDLTSKDGLTYWAHPYDLFECPACAAVVSRFDLSPDLVAYPDFPRNWWKQ